MSETVLQREVGISSRTLAVMSYLGVLCLVPLVMNRNDSYVQFHARQGVVLWMWEVLAIYTLLVPAVGHVFFRISSIACLVLSVIGVLSVLLGRAWKFPIIGDWAAHL
jgi:fumarate reductase subunit D